MKVEVQKAETSYSSRAQNSNGVYVNVLFASSFLGSTYLFPFYFSFPILNSGSDLERSLFLFIICDSNLSCYKDIYVLLDEVLDNAYTAKN